METRPDRRIKAQNVRLRTIIRDKLGEGIWGLEEKEKFTHEEIVFLFARIFSALGFDYIKQIRTEYPDCICVKDNKEVRVEFEPVLSAFRDHIGKDDLNLCKYIVCWKDDLDLDDSILEEAKKFNIEIIELERIFKEGKIRDKDKSMAIDISKLRENQLMILKAFINLGKEILTMQEIADATGFYEKAFAGAISGLTQRQKGKIDWIVRQRPDKRWEMNPQHRSTVVETLKKFKM